jgi:hypothetical protein
MKKFSIGGSNKASLKSFYNEMKAFPNHDTRDLGMQWIEVQAIIGSVGRASELDNKFFTKGNKWNDRHKRINNAIRAGKPMEPIKVFLLQNEGKCEYFVVDGHHRVALAKYHGYEGINAIVTEVIIS